MFVAARARRSGLVVADVVGAVLEIVTGRRTGRGRRRARRERDFESPMATEVADGVSLVPAHSRYSLLSMNKNSLP